MGTTKAKVRTCKGKGKDQRSMRGFLTLMMLDLLRFKKNRKIKVKARVKEKVKAKVRMRRIKVNKILENFYKNILWMNKN